MTPVLDDEQWMRRALALANLAAERGEIPIGAVIVDSRGGVISESANLKESVFDPLGHAEILVIREAARKLGRWRLSDCSLYVTLEPCTMCAGAIIHARLGRVVYATPDPKAGAVHSLYEILGDTRLNHRPQVVSGVLQNEAATLLSDFFKNLRSRRRCTSPSLSPALSLGDSLVDSLGDSLADSPADLSQKR